MYQREKIFPAEVLQITGVSLFPQRLFQN